MTTLNGETTFEIQAPHSLYSEEANLILLPENNGVNARRELHYPGNTFPPIIYPDDPDETINFDSLPLTARPTYKIEKTIAGQQTAMWPGYTADLLVSEIWRGSEKTARMTAYNLRRLIEYFLNPPLSGMVKWIPKDKGDTVGYWVRIHNLTVAGADIKLNMTALYYGEVVNEIVLSFQILGVAT
jgi:hypothetical protein